MVEFFIMVARFVAAIGRSLRREARARALLFFVAVILVSGTIFFMEIEHWSLIDALYYCVTTLTTVGNSGLAPHTDAGKIFTIVYIFMGLGAVLATAEFIARHAMEQTDELSPFSKRNKKK